MNTNMRHYILLFIFYRRTVHTEKIPGQKFWPHKTIHDILLHVKCEGMSHEREREKEADTTQPTTTTAATAE